VFKFLHNKFIKPIFTIHGTPHSIALGVSMGMFVALTPTVGLQMLICVVIGSFIRANRIIAVILCWISNPITFIPMYYGYYWLGSKILGVKIWTFSNFSERMNDIISTGKQFGYSAILKQLGSEAVLPLWVGSLIIAVVVSLPLYPLVLRVLKEHRRKNGLDEGTGYESNTGNPTKEENKNKILPVDPPQAESKESTEPDGCIKAVNHKSKIGG